MHALTVDQTPATFWIVNPDNYVERNIAAGSTHYGIWFFPEPKVRGAPPRSRRARARSARDAPPLTFAGLPSPSLAFQVRGASEFEPGASSICPQGVPLLYLADNEVRAWHARACAPRTCHVHPLMGHRT